ncbi:hypothetical protein [Streptomyces sp. NPDC051561]|uniref:hypothetical protein n=1 Tax=Streptomyces sp. NPDC051561 TaxID=3365658 RepID=UPI00378BFDC9
MRGRVGFLRRCGLRTGVRTRFGAGLRNVAVGLLDRSGRGSHHGLVGQRGLIGHRGLVGPRGLVSRRGLVGHRAQVSHCGRGGLGRGPVLGDGRYGRETGAVRGAADRQVLR